MDWLSRLGRLSRPANLNPDQFSLILTRYEIESLAASIDLYVRLVIVH